MDDPTPVRPRLAVGSSRLREDPGSARPSSVRLNPFAEEFIPFFVHPQASEDLDFVVGNPADVEDEDLIEGYHIDEALWARCHD